MDPANELDADSPDAVRCMYVNARSIAKPDKLSSLLLAARNECIDIVCVVESWLHQGISDAELSDNGLYSVFRRDRGLKGGGVLILARNVLNCAQIEVTCQDVEMLCMDVITCADVTRIISAYLPGTEGSARNKKNYD